MALENILVFFLNFQVELTRRVRANPRRPVYYTGPARDQSNQEDNEIHLETPTDHRVHPEKSAQIEDIDLEHLSSIPPIFDNQGTSVPAVPRLTAHILFASGSFNSRDSLAAPPGLYNIHRDTLNENRDAPVNDTNEFDPTITSLVTKFDPRAGTSTAIKVCN